MAIKVLVVDDSALMRRLLTDLLETDPNIKVVGVAHDPFMARDKIKSLNPDVLTLDIEMPKMDGITFLKNLMRLRPMPVVMVSTLTEKGAKVTMRALELGAVDFFAKPKVDLSHGLEEQADELIRKVKAAARARVRSGARSRPAPVKPIARAPSRAGLAAGARPVGAHPVAALGYHHDRLIAIGSSTGGTEALKDVLTILPPDSPTIVIAQHIPPVFSNSLAMRLNDLSRIKVSEARDGEVLEPGHAYIAPGSHHLLVRRNGGQYLAQLSDGEKVNRHRPSVDVLFGSVLKAAGKNSVAAILTGMGDDGARGLKALHDAGVATVAQDEATSVVWGMPGSAVKLGAADKVLPLGRIAQALYTLAKR